jgi:hypothetical protein
MTHKKVTGLIEERGLASRPVLPGTYVVPIAVVARYKSTGFPVQNERWSSTKSTGFQVENVTTGFGRCRP